jgi:LmbE family N-acetylglucosaminyl deacetylase
MLRLLCVTAHPDDEAGGFGGSLRLYAQRGVQTTVICLTDGQAATHRGEAKTGEELGKVRRVEIERSCKLLGVSHCEVVGFKDGALDRTPFLEVVAHLVQRIREIKPHVMMTFGTEGAVTAHRDHSMAAMFATAAYHWAGRPKSFPEQVEKGLAPWRVQKLYYGTSDFLLPDRQPVSPAPWTTAIEIGEEGVKLKRNAFAAHTTQNPLLPVFEKTLEKRGVRELYHLANSVHQMPGKMESDLFEGVEEGYGG